MPERLPFQATQAAAPYQALGKLPVSILLDNVRSLYNVGAFFRTADAAGVEKLYLCGITGFPPKRDDRQDRPWFRRAGCLATHLDAHRARSAVFVHKAPRSRPSRPPPCRRRLTGGPGFPSCVIFGHEVDGIRPEVSDQCDTHVRI